MGHGGFRSVRLVLALTVYLGLWLGSDVQAESQTESETDTMRVTLEPVLVTGTVLPSTTENGGASVTVITKEQIAAQQVRSVTDLLRQVPGLHVDQAGGGGVGSLYLRGADPNYTVVLIDGVKVNDSTNSRGGSFDLSTLDVANVERVEIVRGPMSAIYGSDALAGVVKIVTPRGASESVRGAEVSGGPDGYRHAVLRAQGVSGDAEYSLSGSYFDSGTGTEGSALVNRTIRGNFGGRVTRWIGLRSTVSYTDGHRETFPEDSGGPTFAVLREVEEGDSTEMMAGIEVSATDPSAWIPDLSIQYYDRQDQTDSPGVAPGVRDPIGIPPNVSDSRYRRQEVTLLRRFIPTEQLTLGLGIDGQSETGSNRGALSFGGTVVPTDFEMDRQAWAPFVEGRYAVSERLRVHAGLRLDIPNGFDAELSVRSALSYRIPSAHTTFRLSWGEGFKLPSFFALGHPIVGNPELLPERSRSGEVAVTQLLWGERVTVRAAYFSTVSSGMIDLEEGPPPQLVNRSKVVGNGVEMEIGIQATGSLYVSSQLTHLTMDIVDTEEELRNRPEWRGGVVVGWRPSPSVTVNVDARYVGRVLDSSIPTGDRYLAPYTRVDLAMTWKTARPPWRYILAVDNVFDADYEEAVGFPRAGITPRIGLQADF